MIKKSHSLLLLLFVTVLSCSSYSLTPPSKSSAKSSAKGVRISFGPVLGFYMVNQNHVKNPVQKPSVLFAFKKEVRLSRDYRSYFLYGFEYFFHGLNFQSYYFKPDSLKLYDKDFAYKYSLFIQEIAIPLQFKYSFRRENNNLFSPYLMIGYHLRYLLPGSLKVTQNGNPVKSDEPGLKFEHPLLSNQMNAYISATIGWQRNHTATSKLGFFVELNYRYGFSPYYFEKDYAPSSLFINSTHLTLQVGLKF